MTLYVQRVCVCCGQAVQWPENGVPGAGAHLRPRCDACRRGCVRDASYCAKKVSA